jgi:hypothetical protein
MPAPAPAAYLVFGLLDIIDFNMILAITSGAEDLLPAMLRRLALF